MKESLVEKAFETARERYGRLGVDVEEALKALGNVSLSIHCWQGDDVSGFETPDSGLSGGGILVTGNVPGRARNIGELQSDLDTAFSLIPGTHRANLHAIYGDFGGERVDRDRIEPKHFQAWVEWASERGIGLDFNATCFSHPLADSGFTLSSTDRSVRAFWIEHVKRCRKISAWIGGMLKNPCVHNLWIPDGSKDITVSRLRHRELLRESLDEIYEIAYRFDHLKDSVESKLFGIGSESYVVGSHEFYLGWALAHGVMVCLDTGHFHPTESVADKVSALLPFFDELLLHVSRGIRWDSDHVVILSDDTRNLAEEVVRAGALDRVHLALDFFDASINRVGAWVIGARAVLKALLAALLEPTVRLREMEEAGDRFGRLALLEEIKTLPLGAVWETHCLRSDAPGDERWIESMRDYEKRVLAKRES